MTTGSALKQAREEAGLSQEQVAEAMGVHRTTVVTWEGKAEVRPSKSNRFLAAVARLAGKAA